MKFPIIDEPQWLVVTKNKDGIENYTVNAPNREEAMRVVRRQTMDKIIFVNKKEYR